MSASTSRYALGPYTIDLDSRTVTRDGAPLKLAWRHFEALKLLVEAGPQVVAREQFFRSLWPDAQIVDESNLTQCISQLRKALGNGDHTPIVETVPRIGYRLVVPATRLNGVALDPPATGLRPPSPVRRAPTGMIIAAAATLVVVAAIAAAGLWWWQTRPAQLSKAAQARGNELTRRGESRAAAQEFQLAIRLNPQNALAYGELAHALNRLSVSQAVATPIGESPSVNVAARGVEVDPQCALCHATYAFFLFYHDWRWELAETHFLRARQLAPESASIRRAYSMLLAATGRLRDALQQIDIAIEREPYDVGWHAQRAIILYLARRYEDSIAAADRALAITNAERAPWEWRSRALFQLGRGEEGVKAMAQVAFADQSLMLDAAVREGGADAGLRALLAVTGDWRNQREQAWRRAPWRALLGDREGALEELERAYELRNVNLLYIAVDPVFDAIRDEPRFQAILRGMGLQSASAGD
jgi:DNA-binding winged helix-turn-helix (wHTH) protein/Tfp pilus assembly protein PilF